MPRPQRRRRVCGEPLIRGLRPWGGPEDAGQGEPIRLSVDECEAIRLVDLGKLTHEECAQQMDISRTTVTEIYESAREKLAQCLVLGRCLEVSGGNYRVCPGGAAGCYGWACAKPEPRRMDMPTDEKGARHMIVATTYENGNIFQHFGRSSQFKLYEVEDGKVVKAEVVGTNGSGHGALAGILQNHRVDALICGGIGGGAQAALAAAGIRLYGGVSGNADQAVEALLAGTLGFNPDVHCDHHDHEHGHHGHACGDHGCGEGHGHGCHEG